MRIFNSLQNNFESFSNNALLNFDRQPIFRKASRFMLPGLKKDGNDDMNDPKILSDLIKEKAALSCNKMMKEENERVIILIFIKKIFNVFKKTTLYVKFLRFFRIDEHSLKQVLN
jgi:hypothetical protein